MLLYDVKTGIVATSHEVIPFHKLDTLVKPSLTKNFSLNRRRCPVLVERCQIRFVGHNNYAIWKRCKEAQRHFELIEEIE